MRVFKLKDVSNYIFNVEFKLPITTTYGDQNLRQGPLNAGTEQDGKNFGYFHSQQGSISLYEDNPMLKEIFRRIKNFYAIDHFDKEDLRLLLGYLCIWINDKVPNNIRRIRIYDANLRTQINSKSP